MDQVDKGLLLIFNPRLLLLLGIADIIHIVSSLLSFSLPAISTTFLSSTAYLHSLPYTLPMAQVTPGWQIANINVSVFFTFVLATEECVYCEVRSVSSGTDIGFR